MKVAFDEHIPPAMAQAFERFAQERQFQRQLRGISIEKAKDYAPSDSDEDYTKGSDVPWIRRFSKAGGRFIISGDTDMQWEPHERLALIEEGMTVFFFSSQWSNWTFFRKCALLMVWWPVIVQKIKRGRKGKFWRIPTSWAEDGKLQPVSTEDRRLVRVERQKAQQQDVAQRRKAKRAKSPFENYGWVMRRMSNPAMATSIMACETSSLAS